MAQLEKVGEHKTCVFSDSGDTVVVFHNTPVVRFDDKRIILDTGGWNTPTTRLRMNQASREYDLGYRVFQEDFVLCLEWKGKIMPFVTDRVELER